MGRAENDPVPTIEILTWMSRAPARLDSEALENAKLAHDEAEVFEETLLVRRQLQAVAAVARAIDERGS